MSLLAVAACLSSLAPTVLGGKEESGFPFVGNSYWQPSGAEWRLSGSCVAVGKNWVIGVVHAGGKRFVIDGKTYDAEKEFRVPNVDLVLWKVSTPLPSFATMGLRPADRYIGKPAKIVACGVGGTVAGKTARPTAGSEGTRRSGMVTISGSGSRRISHGSSFLVSQVLSYALEPNGVHMGTRDSGGGWFVEDGGEWKLVALCGYVHRPPQDGGSAVHLGAYREWIEKTMAEN